MKIRNIVLAIIIVLINVMAWIAILNSATFDVTTEVIKLSITDLLLIIAVAPQPSLHKVESY